VGQIAETQVFAVIPVVTALSHHLLQVGAIFGPFDGTRFPLFLVTCVRVLFDVSEVVHLHTSRQKIRLQPAKLIFLRILLAQ